MRLFEYDRPYCLMCMDYADQCQHAKSRNAIVRGALESDPNGLPSHAPGAKLDAGKPLAGILLDFSRALSAVVEVGTYGAQKYTRGGWAAVPDGVQRYTDAMICHLLAEQVEEKDSSGLRHQAQVAWNALARLELMLREV